MIAIVLKWLTGGGISAIGGEINRWQEIRAKAENDKDRLEADRFIAALQAEAETRPAKWSSILGRLPLFVAEISAAAYLATVLIDSMFPSDWFNPLELPEWFKPHYHAALASVLGIAAAERTAKFFRGKP